MTANFGSSRFVSLVTALLVMFAGLGLGALPAEAASKGKVQVSVSGPKGVKAKVTVAKKGAKSFSVTKAKSKKSGKRTRTVNTGTWKSKPTFVKKGNTFYVAKAAKAKVKKRGTAKMRVKFSKVKVARNPKVASRTDKQIKLKFTAANKKYPVQIRYAQSSKAPKTVKSGKKVSLKKGAKTATIKGLKDNKNHSFSLFTKVNGVWVGPVSLTKVRTKKAPHPIELVSVSWAGELSDRDVAFRTSISDDGRYVAFQSQADNLVEQNTQFNRDRIFLHDRKTGDTTLVSPYVGDTKWQVSYEPIISGDGRYVAFRSKAMVDENGAGVIYNDEQIIRKDLQTGKYELVTNMDIHDNPIDKQPKVTSISKDGRYVAFETRTRISNADWDDDKDVYLRDMDLRTAAKRVSVTETGMSTNADAEGGQVSDDGNHVAFHTLASNMTAGDPSSGWQVYLWSRNSFPDGKKVKRLSVTPNGEPGNHRSFTRSISGDGKLVLFTSQASNIVGTDLPGTGRRGILVRDWNTGKNELMDRDAKGKVSALGMSRSQLSRDGNWIAFESEASDLVKGFDPAGVRNGFLRHRVTKETIPVSFSPNGRPSTVDVDIVAVSANGKHVLFRSKATDLTERASNGKYQLHLWTRR